MTQSRSSSQHKLVQCALWNSWASAKFPISSGSSPHYCHLFILSETCSYSCEYSLPIPDAPSSFSLNIFVSFEAQLEAQKSSTSPCVSLQTSESLLIIPWRSSCPTHCHFLPEYSSHNFLVISKSLREDPCNNLTSQADDVLPSYDLILHINSATCSYGHAADIVIIGNCVPFMISISGTIHSHHYISALHLTVIICWAPGGTPICWP